jgi:hypothetical protein
MRRARVKSASLTSVGYDARRRRLEVEFSRDSIYRYFDVPAAVYRGLLAAPSLGAHLNRHIKPVYRCERVRRRKSLPLSAFGLHANRTADD